MNYATVADKLQNAIQHGEENKGKPAVFSASGPCGFGLIKELLEYCRRLESKIDDLERTESKRRDVIDDLLRRVRDLER